MGHTYVGTEHLLLGLVSEPDSPLMQGFFLRGVTLEKLRLHVVAVSGKGEESYVSAKDMTPRVKRVLSRAESLAKSKKAAVIGCEHLMLSLLQDSDSLAVKLLSGEGVSVKEFEHELSTKGEGVPPSPLGDKKGKEKHRHESALLKFGRDLTALAKDPVVTKLAASRAAFEKARKTEATSTNVRKRIQSQAKMQLRQLATLTVEEGNEDFLEVKALWESLSDAMATGK